MRNYEGLKAEVLHTLEDKLSSQLYYHGTAHTLDVLEVCEAYIERENIGAEEAELLRIGALLHDMGFTITRANHEKHSMALAAPLMDKYGYTPTEVGIVQKLIQSTKIPQSPETLMEKILCDSDLDYLGREDFYHISELLYKELRSVGKVDNRTDWNMRQIAFLEAHRYHTSYARKHRQQGKEARIVELKGLLGDRESGHA